MPTKAAVTASAGSHRRAPGVEPVPHHRYLVGHGQRLGLVVGDQHGGGPRGAQRVGYRATRLGPQAGIE